MDFIILFLLEPNESCVNRVLPLVILAQPIRFLVLLRCIKSTFWEENAFSAAIAALSIAVPFLALENLVFVS